MMAVATILASDYLIAPAVNHAALLERLPELFDPGRTVLEIGGAGQGLARCLERPVVRADIGLEPHDGAAAAVRASILRLPFADRAFDDVVCVDVLQRIAPGERARAIAELVRVAAKRVALSVPAGEFAARVDTAFVEELRQAGRDVAPSLARALELGMPLLGELLEALAATGFAFTIHRSAGVLQHFAAQGCEHLGFLDPFRRMHEQKFPRQAPVGAADDDLPYSYLFVLDATTRVAAGEASPSGRDRSVAPGAVGLFAIGHRVDRMPSFAGWRRILAGARDAAVATPQGMLRDDVGRSIAERNPRYSEMTAIYWVWQNVTGLDAVGFCHYRRYFDFRGDPARAARETYLNTPDQVRGRQTSFTDLDLICRELSAGAVIVATPMTLAIANPEQYMLGHVGAHYLAMLNYVLANHRHYARQAIAQSRDRRLYGNNMFVMRWDDFDELCRFWFDCLFGIEATLGALPAGYQHRVLAFLSERIFDLHLRRLNEAGRRIVERPVFCLHDSALAMGA